MIIFFYKLALNKIHAQQFATYHKPYWQAYHHNALKTFSEMGYPPDIKILNRSIGK